MRLYMVTLWFVISVIGNPAMATSLTDDSTLVIVSYNIKAGRGMDGQLNLRRTADVINRLNPDIVFLQEVDSMTHRTEDVDQMMKLGEWTNMKPVFRAHRPYNGGAYGNGILTNIPIKKQQIHQLPMTAKPLTALSVQLRNKDWESPIWITGIHLYMTSEQRMAQAKKLNKIHQDDKVPVIIGGDFNSTADSKVMRYLSEQWQIPAKKGNSDTYPADDPVKEIDYIIFKPSKYFKVLESYVAEAPLASDHRPYVLKLKLK